MRSYKHYLKTNKYVGPNLVFCCWSAPRTLQTAGMTDVWTDGQTDIIKGLWASAVVLNNEDLVQDSMYCTVLYCTVLYCTVLYCTLLYCIVLYCIVLYCIVLYCTVLYSTVYQQQQQQQ